MAGGVLLCLGGSLAAAQGDLLEGASTTVAAEHNPGFSDPFDASKPLVVRTRVTAARFHVDDTPSNALGGLSDAPAPALRQLGDVAFYEVSGELSGYGLIPSDAEDLILFFNGAPHTYVYGPIDSQGVDRSEDCDSPRYGLKGMPFRLAYPAEGWNGRLLVYRTGYGGDPTPAHHMEPAVFDEMALIEQGWAFFAIASAAGAADDSNPRSPTSDLFSGRVDVASARFAQVEKTSDGVVAEAKGPLSRIAQPTMDPGFNRDTTQVAKNLLARLLGAPPSRTYLFAWSFGHHAVWQLNHGRASVGPVVDGLTLRNGGNHQVPYDAQSGLVFDGFVCFAGAMLFQNPAPDAEHPVTAPVIYASGTADLSLLQLSQYHAARQLAPALAEGETLDAWMRLYHLQNITHFPRDAAFAAARSDSGLYYDFAGLGPTDVRSGERLRWQAVRRFEAGWVLEELSWMFARGPRLTPFFVRGLESLHAWADDGTPPPASRLDDALLGAAAETPIPLDDHFAIDEGCQALDPICIASLAQDTFTQDPFFPVEPFRFLLFPGDVEAIATAAEHLSREPGPIRLPEDRVRVGFYLHTWGSTQMRPFTEEELILGAMGADGVLYAGYANHGDYVERMRGAVHDLVEAGLYDRKYGMLLVVDAARSDYPARRGR